jgi:hypothetical protein
MGTAARKPDRVEWRHSVGWHTCDAVCVRGGRRAAMRRLSYARTNREASNASSDFTASDQA